MDLLTVLGQRRFDTLWREAQAVFPATRYGVVADGVTDAAPAIQAAVTAAQAVGADVLLPAGTVRIASLLTIEGKPVRLRGMGNSLTAATSATVLKVDAGVSGILIDGNAAAGTVLEDFFLDSQSSALGTDDGITVRAPRCTVRRVTANHFGRSGIFLSSAGGKNANLNRFEKCRTTNNYADGFKSDGVNDGATVDSNNALIDQLDSTGNGGYGINSGGGAPLILKPQLAANTSGSMRFSGNSPVILHPYIENDAGKAALATSTSGYGMWISGSFGSVLPTLSGATPSQTWTVQRLGNWERAIRIADETNGGKTWEIASGVRSANELSIKNATDGKYLCWVDVDGSGNPTSFNFASTTAFNTRTQFDASGQTTGIAPINLYVFNALTTGQSAYITARVVGVKSDQSQMAGYTVVCRAKNVAGTVTLVSQAKLDEQEDDATWDAAFVVASNVLRLEVTGAAATTVNWYASFNTPMTP